MSNTPEQDFKALWREAMARLNPGPPNAVHDEAIEAQGGRPESAPHRATDESQGQGLDDSKRKTGDPQADFLRAWNDIFKKD